MLDSILLPLGGVLLAAGLGVGLYFKVFGKKSGPKKIVEAKVVPPADLSRVSIGHPERYPPYEPYNAFVERTGWKVPIGDPELADIPYEDLHAQWRRVMQHMDYEEVNAVGHYNAEPWGKKGDCDKFVVTFRAALMEKFPQFKSSYRVAHCLTRGKGSSQVWHAVLLVWTTQGVYVLDNLKGAPWPVEQTGYDPNFWLMEYRTPDHDGRTSDFWVPLSVS